jgi:hypothetical protein
VAFTFSFERDLLGTLELVPLTVRRKLDLARLKVSLAGWQALPLASRRALTEALVDDDASVAAFARTLRELAVAASVELVALPRVEGHPWRGETPPADVGARVTALGGGLGSAVWRGLDDDARFAILHLARDPRREDRLRAALVELGVRVV